MTTIVSHASVFRGAVFQPSNTTPLKTSAWEAIANTQSLHVCGADSHRRFRTFELNRINSGHGQVPLASSFPELL